MDWLSATAMVASFSTMGLPMASSEMMMKAVESPPRCSMP